MRKLILFSLSLILVLTALFAYIGLSKSNSVCAVLECPSQFDLGECEAGTFNQRRFTITNRGSHLLKITEIMQSCSCARLYRDTGEVKQSVISEPLSELEISANSSCKVVLQQAVNWNESKQLHGQLWFKTNDPKQPQFNIEIIGMPVRGISIHPPALALGNIIHGQIIERIVEIRDYSDKPREIQRLINTHSEFVELSEQPLLNDMKISNQQYPVINLNSTLSWLNRGMVA
jgi:hypothetical protein